MYCFISSNFTYGPITFLMVINLFWLTNTKESINLIAVELFMDEFKQSTKILVIDNDYTSFQVHECIAKALGTLKHVEMVHASDVTEALRVMERMSPDAILVSEEDRDEHCLLLDSIGAFHPPILLQTNDKIHFEKKQSLDQDVMYVPFYDTLEGIHQLITLLVAIGEKHCGKRPSRAVH